MNSRKNATEMQARNAHGEQDIESEKRERTRRGALPEERGHRAQTRPNARHTQDSGTGSCENAREMQSFDIAFSCFVDIAKISRKRKRNADKRKGRRASQRVFLCKKHILLTSMTSKVVPRLGLK
jgi:hypothetical protein